MTAAEKRKRCVAIAKDVLGQLKAQRYEARPGRYFQLQWKSPLSVALNTSLQAPLKKEKPHCRVCALGGLFLSFTRLYNQTTFDDMHNEDFSHLVKVFGRRQLAQIEGAFEGAVFHVEDARTSSATSQFYRKYANKPPVTRLRAIMRNIIKNEGRFKP